MATMRTSALLTGSGSVTSYTLNSAGDITEKQFFLERKNLSRQYFQLQENLRIRPFDVSSLKKLMNVSYQLKKYDTAISTITKLISLSETSADLYLLLAKCHFRHWMDNHNETGLICALNAYKQASDIPDITKTPSPVPWFEMLSVLLRLGRHQAALDVLGLVLTLFKRKEHESWAIICQYNVAQIMLILRQFEDAYEVYQDLVLYKADISVDIPADAIVLVPVRLKQSTLIVEIAHLTKLLGEESLGQAMYAENWLSIPYSLKNGHTRPAVWIKDADTLKLIASFFYAERNIFMAAEFYGLAAEVVSGEAEWDQLPADTQSQVLELVLTRGEWLSELHSYEAAEHCAQFAVSRANGDLVIMSRAGRCCRMDGAQSGVAQSAAQIVRAVLRVQWALRSVFWRIREKLKVRRINKATKLASFIRMCLVRNRLVEDRLGHLSAVRMYTVATRLRKVVWKSGRKIIDDYMAIWNGAAQIIQRKLLFWKSKRSWHLFWTGVQEFKRILKGQWLRLRLREEVASFSIFDTNKEGQQSSLSAAEDPQMVYGCGAMLRCSPSSDANVDALSTQTILAPRRRDHWSTPPSSTLHNHSSAQQRARYLHADSMLSSRAHHGLAWFQGPAKNRPSHADPHRPTSSQPTAAIQASSAGDSEEGDDIVCCISIWSMQSAGLSQRWIPFCIMPDNDVYRMLCCTVLSITSPSFCVTDAKRMRRIAQSQKRITNFWTRIRSLIIYGTRMGESGLQSILSIGTGNLRSLSIGYTGFFTHKCSLSLARQLMLPSASLTKLYIDGEVHLGDRGAVILLKHLQYNSSIKTLSLRNNKLGTRTANACGRLLGVSQTLQFVNLNDNCFSTEDILVVLRAVASRGARGAVECVSIKDQVPVTTDATLRALFQYASSLGVRVDCDINAVDAVFETKLELSRPQAMDEDVRWNKSIRDTMSVFQQDGSLLELGLSTKYSKKLIL